ncbi:MAG: hypothetical protein WBA76_14675 [Phormidesmis sp.]
MISFDFSDTAIQAAVVSGIFTVLSALIAAIAAATIGQAIAKGSKLKADLKTACDDIKFLLAVEKLHCDRNEQELQQSLKNVTRREVTASTGLAFSQKFTPGRVRSNPPF